VTFNTKHLRKDGSQIDVEIHSKGILIDNRYCVFASARDITGRIQTENALRESECKLMESQRVARVGHYDLDIVNGVWTSSKMLDEIFGIDESFHRDVDGWLGLVHPDEQNMMSEYLNEIVTNKTNFDKEYRIVRPSDSAVVWLRGLGELEFENGNAIHMFGVIKDITEQKDSERENRESRQLLNAIIENIPTMVFLKDAKDLRFVLFNNASEDLLGYSRADLIGKSDYDFWPKEQADWFVAKDKEVLDSHEAMETLEEQITTASTEIKYLHTWKITLRDENDKPTHLLGISVDITESKKMQEKLKKFNEELQNLVNEETQKRIEQEKMLFQQSKMAMMGDMIGAIAHQWRQPLNALGISIQDVEAANQFGELNDEYISRFKTESMQIIKSMSKTIDDFRNFFKPSKEKEDFKLEKAIEQSFRIMEALLKNNGIELRSSLDGEHRVLGYKNELQQVMIIIL
jgi:PAS domain S-box-containing protein